MEQRFKSYLILLLQVDCIRQFDTSAFAEVLIVQR